MSTPAIPHTDDVETVLPDEEQIILRHRQTHRPLGSINRVRRRAYDELGRWRHEQNARIEQNPVTLSDVPD